MNIPRLLLFVLVWLAFNGGPTSASDWASWRGPESMGTAPSGEYPIDFSPEKNVVWSLDLPGPGRSTPIVQGETLYLTCEVNGEDVASAFHLEGRLLWTTKLGPGRPGKHRSGGGSCPSAVTDGQRVVTYFKSGTVACLDASSGRLVWEKNLQADYGQDDLWWDLGTSPVLTKHGVVIAVLQTVGSYLICLDVDSGKVVWKQPRLFVCPNESDQSYSTPLVRTSPGGEEILLVWGADHLTAHLATTGAELWRCAGFNPDQQPAWRTIASPVANDDLALVSYGRGGWLAAIRLGGTGDVTQKNRLWERGGIGADVPTLVLAPPHVYVLSDGGVVSCVTAATGDLVWSEKLPRGRGRYYASPLLADGNLYCCREDGMVFVVDTNQQGALVAKNDLGEPIIASPIPVDGDLIIRTDTQLYRFGE